MANSSLHYEASVVFLCIKQYEKVAGLFLFFGGGRGKGGGGLCCCAR